jgi:hypothetical protein
VRSGQRVNHSVSADGCVARPEIESKERPICLQHKYRLKFNLITRRTADCCIYAKLITPTCLSAVYAKCLSLKCAPPRSSRHRCTKSLFPIPSSRSSQYVCFNILVGFFIHRLFFNDFRDNSTVCDKWFLQCPTSYNREVEKIRTYF